jgi:hypothetical protein
VLISLEPLLSDLIESGPWCYHIGVCDGISIQRLYISLDTIPCHCLTFKTLVLSCGSMCHMPSRIIIDLSCQF